MLWQFITCLAFTGIHSVYADSHECATTAKIAEVNAIVASLGVNLGPILQNISLTDDQRNAMILDKVCNDTQGVRAQVDNIEAKLGECAALATASEVKNLTLGAMSFKDLFERFDNVDNFCECIPAMMQAMVMRSVKSQLMYTMTGAQYPVIKLSVLCGTPAVQTAVKTVAAEHKGKCRHVWKYAYDFLNDKDNVIIMRDFVNLVCNNYNDTKFMCAMQGSATTAFKTCISGITGDDMMAVKCERNDCVMNNLDESCGDGRTWYKWAVNMELNYPNTFQLDADKCGNGVTSVFASSSLILFALFTMFFF